MPKPGLSYAVRQTQVNISIFDYAKLDHQTTGPR